MRILMVTTSFPRHEGDHAGHFVASLAERVAQLGHDVTVLAPHEGRLPSRETMGAVRIERFRYLPGWAEQVAYGGGIVVNLRHKPLAVLGLLPFAASLRRAVRSSAPGHDIIHLHWGPTAALAAPWRLYQPYVLTLHGTDVTLAQTVGAWRLLLKRALADAAGVNVVAESQRRFLLDSGLIGDGRALAVIPAGIPEHLLDRPRAPRENRSFVFLFVGRLVETKGVPDLLAAFARARERGVDAVLDIVGTGPLERAVRSAAGAMGANRVRLHGWLPHDQALDTIARAGALLLPSYGEGSPLVVAEALALGTPVVGTKVGAMPDLLGSDGLLVDPGDVQELATAMERIATDHDLWTQTSERGRAYAASHLTWSAIADATVVLYRKAAEEDDNGANRKSTRS